MGKKVYPRTIVEEAPSHDGKPCYAAWEMIETDPDTQTPPDASNRPKWSIQIYETTPAAGDREYIKGIAKKIEEKTRRDRDRREAPNRIDIHGFPLPADLPEADRVARCVAHHRAEVAMRNASGTADFFIPPNFSELWEYQIIIIDNPGAAEPGGGAFLTVSFGMRPEVAAEGLGGPDYDIARYTGKCLGDRLWSYMSFVEYFYDSYVENGRIYSDLEKWRREAEAGGTIQQVEQHEGA
ncbi:hypothetical protein K4K60_003869 [Colletotrichum sp. SAR11_57]|nr:hypothetical protein CGCF245_v004406 [Colletotrichum fructicola]KAI8281978.1 hypothetical protein K4K60_003869 [Colletotrichum sp. SAR11_57]